jgi:hypothetical protein
LTVHGNLENLKPTSIPKERLFLLPTALNPTHWLSFLLSKGLDKRIFLVVLAHLFCSYLLFLSKNLRLQNSLLCLSRVRDQVRSNTFVDHPWQLREFKTDINTKGEAVFVADSVKSNPLAELFAKQGDLDSLPQHDS